VSRVARLRAPGPDDASFLFGLAAANDLRWPAVTRFSLSMTPSAVISALQTTVEVGYLVLNEERRPVGVVGFVDPDTPSRVMWLDGHAMPGDREGLQLVREAVPTVLDEAARSGNVRFVYYEEYVELGASIIVDDEHLWEAEVTIPRFVCIDGLWCTRVTWCLRMTAWENR
jgi:hypothetical protein